MYLILQYILGGWKCQFQFNVKNTHNPLRTTPGYSGYPDLRAPRIRQDKSMRSNRYVTPILKAIYLPLQVRAENMLVWACHGALLNRYPLLYVASVVKMTTISFSFSFLFFRNF